MIQKLSIRNFKSIRELDLDCRRVNVFIGEPNAGKTNILEALGLWCYPVLTSLKKALRINSPSQLHFDNDFEQEIKVTLDGESLLVRDDWFGHSPVLVQNDGDPKPVLEITRDLEIFDPFDSDKFEDIELLDSRTRYYLFSDSPAFRKSEEGRLACPFGANLFELLVSNKSARQTASAFFQGSGLKMNLDTTTSQVLVTKEMDGTLITFSYEAASETLRRMIFYNLALNTNKDQVLVLDEPEAHSFPPFTKILAETIAQNDRGNQFFLTTHSPYLLTSLISKTPVKDLNVVLCRMENFETKGYVMTEEQKLQLMEWDMSAFFNFDRLLPELE